MLLGELFHFFLPRTLYARHPEASRITTHEALSRLWRAHAALLFLPSPPACAMGFLLLRGLFAFFATSTRCALSVELTLQGLGQRGVSGTAFGLLPGLCGASFVQHQSLEKTTSSPCMAKIFVLKIGQRRKPKSAAIHSIALFQVASLSTLSLVGVVSIPCTLPVVVWNPQVMWISPCGLSARRKQGSKVLPLPFRRLYHKLSLSLLRHLLQGVLYQLFRCFFGKPPP